MQILKGFLSPNSIEKFKAIANSSANWQEGRQETGYQKASMKDVIEAQGYIGEALSLLGKYDDFWDAWLLLYPNDAYIPPHHDDTAFGREKHMRLNALVSKPTDGGILTIDNKVVELDVGDAVIFIPNKQEHSVSKVAGERLIFSVGCWI